MEIASLTALTTTFAKGATAILADSQRQGVAKIDIELIDLKRRKLRQNYDDFEWQSGFAVDREKSLADEGLRKRGLLNSSLRTVAHEAIKQAAIGEFAKVHREFHFALEELSLNERRIRDQSKPLWRRVLPKRGK